MGRVVLSLFSYLDIFIYTLVQIIVMFDVSNALVFGLSASVLILASLGGSLIDIEHSFPSYNRADTKLEVSCGLLSSSSNIGRSEVGVGSCATLIRDINFDNNAIFFVIPSGVAPQVEVMDYAGLLILVFSTLSLTMRAVSSNLFVLVFARYGFLVSAILGIILVNSTLGAIQSLHAAPDPGASSTAQVGLAFVLLAGTPLVALTTSLKKKH